LHPVVDGAAVNNCAGLLWLTHPTSFQKQNLNRSVIQ